jgi:hypothetical protein
VHELQVGGTVRRKGLGKFLLLLCEMVRPCSGLSPHCGLINRAKITLPGSPTAIGLAAFWALYTSPFVWHRASIPLEPEIHRADP